MPYPSVYPAAMKERRAKLRELERKLRREED